MFTEDTSLRLPAYDALLFRSEKYIIVALTMAGVPAHTGCLGVQNILDECNRIVCEALQIRIGESERHQPLNDDVEGAIIVSVRAGTVAEVRFQLLSYLKHIGGTGERGSQPKTHLVRSRSCIVIDMAAAHIAADVADTSAGFG